MALSICDLILITIRELRGNVVRSSLTALGIFMGVAAVNATLNISAITNTQIEQKLLTLDNPYIAPLIRPERWRFGQEVPTLDEATTQLIHQQISGIQSISNVTSVALPSGVQYQDQIVTDIQIRAVSVNYQKSTGRQIVAGRFFDTTDYEEYWPVAIVDQILANQLFGEKSPLGEGIFAGGTRFTVIGVSESKLHHPDGTLQGELWITSSYGSSLSGRFRFSSTQIALAKLEDYQEVQDQVKRWLEQRYPHFDIHIISNAEDLYKEQQQQRTSAIILQVAGMLALIIGGVGIANITVASVVERTREIGLRRAIGATDWEIMLQFITEALFLSLIGGSTAVASVHGLTLLATTTIFPAPYTFMIRDALISMGSAFLVGGGASFFPALRVTQINVVQALRGE